MYDEKDWVFGNISLGTAASWSADEIRLVAELGFALAQNGRNHEAITIFEGLNTLAPATPYFEAALGSLWLRENHPARALVHIDAAISENPEDLMSYVNRGEAYLRLERYEEARRDLEVVLESAKHVATNGLQQQFYVRAAALHRAVNRFSRTPMLVSANDEKK
jgi:tetratricopeptide (TPR) repeat protein